MYFFDKLSFALQGVVIRMDYIEGNKEAWEEAFEHKYPGWGEANHERLMQESLPFFCPDVAAELKAMDFSGKTVAQFCCNNGRELLSLLQLGAKMRSIRQKGVAAFVPFNGRKIEAARA